MGSQAAARRRPGLRRDDSFISIGSFYGEPQVASEQDAIPLPPFHWELLEGGAAPSNRPGGSRERQKVILLHGWHQESSSWRETARGLQTSGGYDVLLIDFYNHGKSQGIYPFYRCNIETLVAQVRSAVERLGWEREKLVFGGLSLGGAVSLRYTHMYPDSVGSIILVASPGLTEPAWSLVWLLVLLRMSLTALAFVVALIASPLTRHLSRLDIIDPGCARARCSRTNYRHTRRGGILGVILLLFERLAGHCRLVWDTPCYGVPSDMPAFLRDNGIKLSMVWGKADILHTAQTRRWAAGRRVSQILVPHWEHGLCCTLFDKQLKLHEKVSWWSVE